MRSVVLEPFRTQTFGCAAYQERFTLYWGRNLELPAQCSDPLQVDFGLQP